MKKVITYGSFDLLHYGHLNLLKRAKSLGDYLIVGVTSPLYDMQRGKINLQQSLNERIKALEETGLVDEIIIEEYEGQKIDDIKKYNVDIFAIGSDWITKFDYLKEYCEVVYLERTEGISSSEIRKKQLSLKLGIYSDSNFIEKIIFELKNVNGLYLNRIYFDNEIENPTKNIEKILETDFEKFIEQSDVIYLYIRNEEKYALIKKFLELGKHVICESPLALTKKDCEYLYKLAKKKDLILLDCLKTAYSFAFSRIINLIKSGAIGDVKYLSANCSSLQWNTKWLENEKYGGGMNAWGAYLSLVVNSVFGCTYNNVTFEKLDNDSKYANMVKINFSFEKGLATCLAALGIKTEGDLIISGTKGYIYVPSPWWKTEYFEIRYENQNENRKFYYKLNGEGIPMAFVKFIELYKGNFSNRTITNDISIFVSDIYEKFNILQNNYRDYK